MNRKWRCRRFKSQISLKSSPVSQTPKSSLTFKKHTNSRHMSASMAPDFISLSIYMFKNTKISYKTFGIHDHSKPWQEATKETFHPEREGCVGNVTWDVLTSYGSIFMKSSQCCSWQGKVCVLFHNENQESYQLWIRLKTLIPIFKIIKYPLLINHQIITYNLIMALLIHLYQINFASIIFISSTLVLKP